LGRRFERGIVPVIGVVVDGERAKSLVFLAIIPSHADFTNHGNLL